MCTSMCDDPFELKRSGVGDGGGALGGDKTSRKLLFLLARNDLEEQFIRLYNACD